MNCINPRNIVAFSLILFAVLIAFGSIYGQDRTKEVQRALSVPEIVLPDINLSGLMVAEIDTTALKTQLEIISAKRKELAEFERHFKSLLKLQRQAK
jgi:hypothetical protein